VQLQILARQLPGIFLHEIIKYFHFVWVTHVKGWPPQAHPFRKKPQSTTQIFIWCFAFANLVHVFIVLVQGPNADSNKILHRAEELLIGMVGERVKLEQLHAPQLDPINVMQPWHPEIMSSVAAYPGVHVEEESGLYLAKLFPLMLPGITSSLVSSTMSSSGS
jgi:hypothetical protein